MERRIARAVLHRFSNYLVGAGGIPNADLWDLAQANKLGVKQEESVEIPSYGVPELGRAGITQCRNALQHRRREHTLRHAVGS